MLNGVGFATLPWLGQRIVASRSKSEVSDGMQQAFGSLVGLVPVIQYVRPDGETTIYRLVAESKYTITFMFDTLEERVRK